MNQGDTTVHNMEKTKTALKRWHGVCATDQKMLEYCQWQFVIFKPIVKYVANNKINVIYKFEHHTLNINANSLLSFNLELKYSKMSFFYFDSRSNADFCQFLKFFTSILNGFAFFNRNSQSHCFYALHYFIHIINTSIDSNCTFNDFQNIQQISGFKFWCVTDIWHQLWPLIH